MCNLHAIPLLVVAVCAAAETVAHRRFESILRRPLQPGQGASQETPLDVEGVGNLTVYIRTRDNVALRTVFYYPTSLITGNGTLGTVLERTPYNADSLADSCIQYATLGFVCAAQDFRGKFLSNGSFAFWTDAGNDAADTMQFITSQSWSNGRVGSTGGSANAIAAYMQPLAEPGPPSALKVAFNIVGQGLLHETTFQGGAYRESLISGWLTANGNEAYIPTVTANEAWNPYWNSTDFAAGPRWDLWNFPAVHAAGFYDIFSTKQIQTVLAINTQGGPQAQGLQYLIVDPGGHCAGGAINWTNATWGWGLAESFSLQLFAEALDFNLSAVPAETLRRWSPVDMDVAKRLMQTTTTVWYVLGPGEIFSTGNFWVGGDGFPTPVYTPYYLITTGRQLSLTAPTDTNSGNNFAVFPGSPLGTIGGNNLILTPCGPQDQSSLEKDHALEMVVFTSAVLDENVAVRVSWL
jgi:predicted acyl esterase